MKNIFKLLRFYREEELESKWWHRLMKVLIYGSTIVIFTVSIGLFISNINIWNNPDPKYIYSFEPKYSKTFGFSNNCIFTPENNEDNLSIKCGYLNGKKTKNVIYVLPDFLDRYAKFNSYKEEFLRKIPFTGCDGISSSVLCRFSHLEVDYKLLNEKIYKGEFNNIKAKRIILITPLIKNVVLTLAVPILWFFLLKSVIYRAFIYIVLGKKK